MSAGRESLIQCAYPWPNAQSSVPTPCGNCPRCGGQMYAYLTHQCSSALPFRDLSPMGGGPKP